MDHSRFQSLLTDAAFNRLPPVQAEAVWDHAAGCRDCLDHIVAVMAVRSALRPEEGHSETSSAPVPAGEHVAADLLASWALGQGSGEPQTMAMTARHLSRCRECRREIAMLRDADRSARARDAVEQWRGRLAPSAFPTPAFAAATAALLVVLAWPASGSLVIVTMHRPSGFSRIQRSKG